MIAFIVENDAFEGVKRVADIVAGDFELVTGNRPALVSELQTLDRKKYNRAVLFASCEKSPLLESLSDMGVISKADICGKREVFLIKYCKNILDFDELVIICGSDKRGTIYGAFTLSEYIGVSPLVFLGDARPAKKDEIAFDTDIDMVSKEPSVEYRGLFINDEWPCFGNWTFEHFEGFTAKMYEHIFELILRLKGNYLWPAMWSSSFALDGPGEESAKLADIYGVVIGTSHHEPCMRAGEEWNVYGPEYGQHWNYVLNPEGLIRYWRDGLERSGKYECLITLGMRGDHDSKLQGPTTFEENVQVLKDIITEQKKLLAECRHYQDKEPVTMLTIYKEVEDYYWGNDKTPGLKDWDGLEGIILMFCEDNFGHMRYLPQEKNTAGYGMYYHLDYHGDPISYEWINSTPLSSVWEEMTVAYDNGIQKVWIVNVGDLKGNEFPLSYFMALAYDYDKWGSSNTDSYNQFTEAWVHTQFAGRMSEKQLADTVSILTRGLNIIGKIRPESLDADRFLNRERDLILKEIEVVETKINELKTSLDEDTLVGFDSMIGDTLLMGLNLVKLQLYASKNHQLYFNENEEANLYADKVLDCIALDKQMIEEAQTKNNCKWKGMYNTRHVGFKDWNGEISGYPEIYRYTKLPLFDYKSKSSEVITLTNFGRHEVGLKATPFMASFAADYRPQVCYEIDSKTEGEATLVLHFAPTNPIAKGVDYGFELSINGEKPQLESLLPVTFRGGDRTDKDWSRDVIAQEHIFTKVISLKEGKNNILISFTNGLIVLEKIELKKEECVI